MLKNLFFNKPIEQSGPANSSKEIMVHNLVAFPVIGLLALAVGIFATTVVVQENTSADYAILALFTSQAQAKIPPKFLKDFTSVDAMKLTKDVVVNQPSAADINNLVDALSQTHARYIAISVPLDATADYPGTKPSPQTAENFTKTWAETIHSHGLKILWRGTWSGLEGLYGFPKRVGPNRFPAGTALTASTDGSTTWLGKTYNYIINHPDYFEDGDIWAPLPERTENIFQDQTSFLPYQGGIQANYVFFFNNLKKVSDQAFAKIGKKTYTGWTANNFSEISSGWLYRSIFDTAELTATDYYGDNHTPLEMQAAMIAAYKKTDQQIFLQEWSDYWNGGLSVSQRQVYLTSMYAVFQKLADQGVIMGFNYWGGWPGTTESIIDKTLTGYKLNSRGLQLAGFFGQNQN